jgi:hypothetical protein
LLVNTLALDGKQSISEVSTKPTRRWGHADPFISKSMVAQAASAQHRTVDGILRDIGTGEEGASLPAISFHGSEPVRQGLHDAEYDRHLPMLINLA